MSHRQALNRIMCNDDDDVFSFLLDFRSFKCSIHLLGEFSFVFCCFNLYKVSYKLFNLKVIS